MQHIGYCHACEGGLGIWDIVACSRSSESRDHFHEGVRESGCRGMDSGCLSMRGVDVMEVMRREWKGCDLIT